MDVASTYTRMITSPNSYKGGVIDDFHERDAMGPANEEHYHFCGADALRNIALSLCTSMRGPRPIPTRILDFGCGHGRVGRYLRAGFPNAAITFCDIDATGVEFCAGRLDDRPMVIERDFSGFDRSARYDLIWVGSVFTHLREEKSRELLELLYSVLAPGGTLVFTTHGRYLYLSRASGTWYYGFDAEKFDDLLAQTEANDYGFVASRRDDYGISMCFPRWLDAEVGKLPEASIAFFSERSWARHHDVTAVRRRET